MRVGLDCTPLLGRRTGIGNYTAHLLAELAKFDGLTLTGTAFTLRGRGQLAPALPTGVQSAIRPIPARLLRACWQHLPLPSARMLCGPVDVFHGTNFVLPPTGRAAGVITVHDLAYLRYPHTVAADSLAYRDLVPRALRRGAHLICPSHAVADQVRQAYPLAADRVHPIHLGVDEQWFATSAPSADWLAARGLPSEYLLAVGTLEPRKNLGVLLDMLRCARRAGRALPPLVLVGGQGWGAELDISGLSESELILTGHLCYDELRSIVAGALALLFPSLDEGFGLPPLEALACGTAVVAADIPVCREVLGDQALYVDPHSAEALVTAAWQVLDGGDGAGRQEWARRFSWAGCAAAHVAVYQELT